MKGLIYQLKSVRKDKFCIMSFLLPIVAAMALNFIGSIDLSSLGEYDFGVIAGDMAPETEMWLGRYGTVTICQTREELIAAINEPSTNLIGVEMDGNGIKTIISGDELTIWQQMAGTLPALYGQRETAAQAGIHILDQPDVLAGYRYLFVAMTLIVAMFMGCTFNAMNIITEKEDGIALINEILPMTARQYVIQKIFIGFIFGWFIFCYCDGVLFPAHFRRDGGHAGANRIVSLCISPDGIIYWTHLGWPDGRRGLHQNHYDPVYGNSAAEISGGGRKRSCFIYLLPDSVQCHL